MDSQIILKRKSYQEMLVWKQKYAPNYALFLKGARRSGKTTLATYFGQKEYKSYMLINFQSANDDVKKLFINGLLDLDTFFSTLEMIYKTKLYPNESLIILDEIQLFPEARQALKTLLEDKRFHYIETGSLAGIISKSKDKRILIPSEEIELNINPLDFEEFLWAIGDDITFNIINEKKNNLKPFGEVMLREIMRKFIIYMCVGGMPQAVIEYATSKDFEKVDFIKRQIIQLYKNDMKEQNNVNQEYVGNLFINIPSELSKHDKQFCLSHLDKNARLLHYNGSLGWLEDAMIVNVARNVNEPSVALSLSMDNVRFKIYLLDTGLLLNLAFDDGSFFDNEYYEKIMLDKLHINEGMFVENIVAQCLKANNHKIRYHIKTDKEKKKACREVDFIIRDKNKIIPIEVKSSSNFSTKSLDDFIKTYSGLVSNGIILYKGDIKRENNLIYLPYFMASVL